MYQLQIVGVLVFMFTVAFTQRWWGPWITDYWRGVYLGALSVFLIMRTKQHVLERALAEASKAPQS